MPNASFFSPLAGEDIKDNLKVKYQTKLFKLPVGESEVAISNGRLHFRIETVPSIVSKILSVVLGFPLIRVFYQLATHRTLAVPLSQFKYIQRRLRPSFEYLIYWAIALYALWLIYGSFLNKGYFVQKFEQSHAETVFRLEKGMQDSVRIFHQRRDSSVQAAYQNFTSQMDSLRRKEQDIYRAQSVPGQEPSAAEKYVQERTRIDSLRRALYQQQNMQRPEADSVRDAGILRVTNRENLAEQASNSSLQFKMKWVGYFVWILDVGLFFGLNYLFLMLLIKQRIYVIEFICEKTRVTFIYEPHNTLDGIAADDRDARIDSFIQTVYETARKGA